MSEDAFALHLRASRAARIGNGGLHLLFSLLILVMDPMLGAFSLPLFFGLAFWNDGRLRLRAANSLHAIGKDRAGWWVARSDQAREAVTPTALTVTAMVMILRWRGDGKTRSCIIWRDSLRDEEYRLLARQLRRGEAGPAATNDDQRG